MLPTALQSALGSSAIGAWIAILFGLLVGGGAFALAFSILRKLGREQPLPPPAQQPDVATPAPPPPAADGER